MTQKQTNSSLGLFGIDTRSLSLFRWIVGLNVILNILKYRLFWVEEFYSDDKWLDDEYIETYYGLFSIANYLPAAGVSFFFFLTLVLAVLYCLGIKTKWIAPALFFAFANAITINPFISHGVEFTIEVCLFWSIFLPIDLHFKPFAKGVKQAPTEIRTLAVWAILIQIALVYFTSVITKNGEFWQEGIAVLSATDDRTHAVGLASWLAQTPSLAIFLNYFTLILESLIFILIFLPWKNQWARLGAAITIPVIHFGLATALDVGPFYFSNLAYAVILLPSLFWNFDFIKKRQSKKTVTQIASAQTAPFQRYVLNAFIVFVLLFIVQRNVNKWNKQSYLSETIQAIPPLNAFASISIPAPGIFMGIWNQPWWLFAPDPYKDMGTILIVGQTGPQEFTELIGNKPFIYQRQNDGTVSFKYPPYNEFTGPRFVFSWYARRYHERIPRPVFQKWLRYELKEWRKEHPGKRLGGAKMFYLTNKTTLVNDELKREKRLLLLTETN